ncbi:MAG: hypothetical protein GX891_04000 [Clostridiales bacterium]|nr:hypothetical protein [Clostridiales bacterium]
MFTDNWYLFILIVLLLFSTDGIDATENALLIAIVFTLTMCQAGLNCLSSSTTEEDTETAT